MLPSIDVYNDTLNNVTVNNIILLANYNYSTIIQWYRISGLWYVAASRVRNNSRPSVNFRPFLGKGQPIVHVIGHSVRTFFLSSSYSVFELASSSTLLQKYG